MHYFKFIFTPAGIILSVFNLHNQSPSSLRAVELTHVNWSQKLLYRYLESI